MRTMAQLAIPRQGTVPLPNCGQPATVRHLVCSQVILVGTVPGTYRTNQKWFLSVGHQL